MSQEIIDRAHRIIDAFLISEDTTIDSFPRDDADANNLGNRIAYVIGITRDAALGRLASALMSEEPTSPLGPLIRNFYTVLADSITLYSEQNQDFLPEPNSSFGHDAKGFMRRRREQSKLTYPLSRGVRQLLLAEEALQKVDEKQGLSKQQVEAFLDFWQGPVIAACQHAWMAKQDLEQAKREIAGQRDEIARMRFQAVELEGDLHRTREELDSTLAELADSRLEMPPGAGREILEKADAAIETAEKRFSMCGDNPEKFLHYNPEDNA